MRRLLMLCVIFLAGCLNVSGTFAPKLNPPYKDDPRLNTTQQEAKARERWAFPDPALKFGADQPDPRLTPYR